jgi:hypothetical protein
MKPKRKGKKQTKDSIGVFRLSTQSYKDCKRIAKLNGTTFSKFVCDLIEVAIIQDKFLRVDLK